MKSRLRRRPLRFWSGRAIVRLMLKLVPTLRRIGKIVLLTFVAIVALYALSIFAITQYYRLYTRTVSERQFKSGGEWWEHDLGAIRKFEARHGLDPERRSGLRLTVDEWPAWKYLISIDALPDGAAKGAIFAQHYDGKGPIYERDFRLDDWEAATFFNSYDSRIKGYWGSTNACTDGTGFQFERWAHGKVSGGHGNAACQRHYAELMHILGDTLAMHLKDAPFDWRTWLLATRLLDVRDVGG